MKIKPFARHPFPKYFVYGIALCLFLPGPVIGQNDERDTGLLKRETKTEKEIAEEATRAREKKKLEKLKKITFEHILEEPDNIELNFRYAQEQAGREDLLGASATLERMLMINPDLHEVRLFYAVTLFRLDNLTEAEREINILEALPLPENLREELSSYKRQIRQKRKRLQFGVRQNTGFGYDHNRNAAPSSKFVLLGETPLGLTGTNRREGDTNFLNITTVDALYDLGLQAGHQLMGSFTYFFQEQTEADSLDLQSFQYEFGGTYKSQWVNVTPTVFVTNTTLSRESYQRTQGGNFLVERNFKNKLNLYLNTRMERQDYLPIEENTTAATDREGPELSINPGFVYSLTANMRVSSGFVYLYKHAKHDFETYDRLMVQNFHAWLLGRGQFLINSVDAAFDYYDEPDVAVASRIRSDKTLRYRAVYGIPLGTLLGAFLPALFKDVTVTFSYEYFRSLSNVTNYTYTNQKFQGLLSKKWDF